MKFSILFFSNDVTAQSGGVYDEFFEVAEFADEHGFEAVWAPERHFHCFGGAYPDPALLCSALAMRTKRVRLRAGSVVLPLHDPLQVTEQWAAVDQLSAGRVDLALAAGWNADDFSLAPSNFEERHKLLREGINEIRALWSGQKVERRNGRGETVSLRSFPFPVQPQPTLWMTCTGGPDRFREAASLDMNVLTGLLFITIPDLQERLSAYRDELRRTSPGRRGRVTLMLHTYVGSDMADVRRAVEGPLGKYLESSAELWQRGDKRLSDLSPERRAMLIRLGVEKYLASQGMFGDMEICAALVERLAQIGVDEIACLVDYGLARADLRECLKRLAELQHRTAGPS